MKRFLPIPKITLLIFLFTGSLLAQMPTTPGLDGQPANAVIFEDSRSLDPCTYTQLSNSFENGRISMHDVYATPNYSADDIFVPANTCMDINQVISNHLVTASVIPSSVNIYFWNDAGGIPGAIVGSYLGVSFTSTVVGSSFGFDVRQITSSLSSTMSLCGGPSGATYWMSVTTATGSSSFWECQTVTPYGSFGMNLLPDFGYPTWTAIGSENYVFSLKYVYRSQIEDTMYVCIDDTLSIGGENYSLSGIAHDTVTSVNGCDSVKTIRVLREYGYQSSLLAGRISMHDVYSNLNQSADDIDVPANQCIIIDGIQSNFWVISPNVITSNNVYFFSDNSGFPGAIYNAQTSLPFSADSITQVAGFYDIYDVRTTLTAPVQLCGGVSGTKYWLSVTVASGANSYWEYHNHGDYGLTGRFIGPDFATPSWSAVTDNYVFALDYHYKVEIATPANTILCTYHAPIPLTATPAGGVFSGPGMVSNVFDPGSAALGVNHVLYTYTTPEGCGFTDTLDITVSPCIGIEDEVGFSMASFPNPTTGIFNLATHSALDMNMNWSVVNLTGQIIMNGIRLINAGDSNSTFDLTSLAPGIYYFNVKSNNIEQTIRLIKL
jgi:hypothetical protein